MRILILLGLLFSLAPVAYAVDGQPTVQITKVKKGSQGKFTVLDFYIKANDSSGIAKIEYRAAVDGKRSGWVKYPYYDVPGYVNHLPFQVDCDTFIFEVRSIDKTQIKSRIAKRTFSDLR